MAKLKVILSLLLLGALVYAAVTHLDARLLAKLFASLSAGEVLGIALLPLGFVLTRAVRFTLLLAPADHRGRLTSLYGYVASQAVSSFPTGIAGRAAVLKNSGVPLQRNMVPLMTDSFFDLSFLGFTTLVVALLVPTYRSPVYVAVPLVICLTPVLLQARPLRRGLKRLTFKMALRWGRVELWKNLRRSVLRLRHRHRLMLGVALTLLANIISLLCLLFAVRAFGLQVPVGSLIVSVTVPALLGRLIFLPGSGTGVVAAGMAAILAQTGGLTANEGAAVAIVYRITDMVMPTVYGWIMLLLVRSPAKWQARELEPAASESPPGRPGHAPRTLSREAQSPG